GAGDRHVLVVAAHHIAVDETSFGVVLDDLSALLAGRQPADATPFAAFAADEDRLHDTAAAQRWRERLAGIPAELELPADRPRPSHPSYRAESVAVPVPAGLAARLAAFAAEQGATPLMVLQT